jgi:hypothetical protein
MASNNGLKVKRNDNAISRVVDGEFVVLLPDGAVIHALGGCGSRVWELIEGEVAVSALIQSICNEYDVEPQRAMEDITEFVHKLVAMKLVDIVPGLGEEASS